MEIKDAALAYLRAGLSIVPAGHNKRPRIKWGIYQKQLPTETEVEQWFSQPDTHIAIINGKVSGNLNTIDFDNKGELYDPWCDCIERDCPGIGAKLVVETSQSGGRHVYYRVAPDGIVEGNTKLAERGIAATADDQTIEVNGKSYEVRQYGDEYFAVIGLIETRGEGGYCVAAPSRGYEIVCGDLRNIPVLSADEHDTLLSCARELNEWHIKQVQSKPHRDAQAHTATDEQPGTDYNNRGDLAALLRKHGWTQAGTRGEREYWTRPGKKTGISASVTDGAVFYPFSSNAAPFEPNESYSKFMCYTLLEHGGDFKAAVKALAAEGYGKRAAPRESSNTTRIDWQPPVSFTEFTLPEFPLDSLPRTLADFVAAEAESTQTPLDLPGCLSLAMLSVALQKKYEARVKAGWTEPLNLFIAVAMDPAHRKSAVFGHMVWPLEEFERQQIKALEPAIAEISLKREVLEKRIDALKKDAAKAADRAAREEIQSEVLKLSAEHAELVMPLGPPRITQDCTVEKLANLLHLHGGRASVLDPEGGLFELMAGRYSESGANFEVFLKGHAGDTLRVDRMGRASEFVPSPALTVAITPQPMVIGGLSSKPGMRGRGLLGRFLYSIPKSRLGHRNIDPAPMPEHIRQRYHKMLMALAALESDWDAEKNQRVPFRMELEPTAWQTLKDFMARLEPRLADGGDLAGMTDWAGKLAGATVRMAALLHIADVADSFGGFGDIGEHIQKSEGVLGISQKALTRSINLSIYFTEHARAAFALMGADAAVADAKKLLRWILRNSNTVFTKRDLYKGVQGTFKSVDAIEPGLELLEKHGFIRELERQNRTGRPSQKYEINPYCQNPQYTQNPTEDAA
ncbi:MAG TPA: DUF3987 domain-containing protein [Planctomycetota bacterium]|nr:DUF3987 domain-containing protein [Planctomycetota bacterium]